MSSGRTSPPSEIALFREDMTALAVIAPDHYVGVVEAVDQVAKTVAELLAKGVAYRVELPAGEGDPGAADVYFDVSTEPGFGAVSSWTREQMMEVFADRGGDPDREGKRDPLDPLLWRAHREGEPSWPGGEIGEGRPGWHIECTSIALDYLGMSFDVQGGGTDLVFPHHEMSAVQATGLTGERPFARAYVHQAMVGLDGEKMSKSRGNLVLVSALRRDGRRPDGDPAGAAGPPLPHAVGLDRPGPGRGAAAPRDVARRDVGQRRAGRRGDASPACVSAWPTTWTRRTRWRRSTGGPARA